MAAPSALPLLTRLLIQVSDLTVHGWPLMLAGLGGPFFFVPMITRMQTVFHGHDIARDFRAARSKNVCSSIADEVDSRP